ncbi:MAG: MBL fold metallo-hydrolase [Nitrospirae bacterium]|nr:MAG: MBL fold metallo-hydrolase [Nitrospirota bacterium]
MIIRCWGARGSIPVSGKEYLKYGGDTACIEIRTKDDEIVIIDSGSGIRRLGNRLIDEDRFAVNLIYTHSHWDHILGFPFFKPLYIDGTSIRLFGCPFAQKSVKEMISRTMKQPNFPVRFEDVKADISSYEICAGTFHIGSMEVTPIVLSHPNQSIGYKFREDGRTFVYMTDNELGFRHPGGLDHVDYVAFASQADLLFHDAEYTEEEYRTKKMWGHTEYRDALMLAMDAGIKKFGLFHHNQERTDLDLDGIVENCREIIREKKSELECFGVHQDMEIIL